LCMKSVVFVFGILLLCSGVLADISISDPEGIYNLGNRLYIDLDGLRGSENGNLDIDLDCGNTTVNMVRIPARAFATDEDQSYSVPYKVLDREDLGIVNLRDIVGNYKGKGLVDYRGDYIFVVFSPLVTKTYGNERLAVRCGMKLAENLVGYNKKFKDKVEFGIGVHAGELVASKKGGKLKYTGIGNTISFAKRMSDLSPRDDSGEPDSGQVVVSDVIRKKLLRELKVVKGKEIGEKVTYVVSSVRDTTADQERLKDLLKRQG